MNRRAFFRAIGAAAACVAAGSTIGADAIARHATYDPRSVRLFVTIDGVDHDIEPDSETGLLMGWAGVSHVEWIW